MDRCSLPTPFGFVTKFGLCYPGAIRSRPYSSIFTLTSELIFRPRMCCWAWLLRQKRQTLRSCLLSFRIRYAKCSGGLDYWIASERIDFYRPLTTACKIISRDTRRSATLAFSGRTAILLVISCHALIFSGIAFPPRPFQLLTDHLDVACDFLKFAPLDPVPTLQHLANASKFLGKGLKAKFPVSNIQTYPENFADISLVVRNTLVGPERLDASAVA